MGSYWSYEEVTEKKEDIKECDKAEDLLKECEKVEDLLKNEINRCDIIEELKNNPLFNEHRKRVDTN